MKVPSGSKDLPLKPSSSGLGGFKVYNPRTLRTQGAAQKKRTHILRLLGPKAILYKAFGLF